MLALLLGLLSSPLAAGGSDMGPPIVAVLPCGGVPTTDTPALEDRGSSEGAPRLPERRRDEDGPEVLLGRAPAPSMLVLGPSDLPSSLDGAVASDEECDAGGCSDSQCRYPVTVLDFLHDTKNLSQLEGDWPCEVRVYWAEQLRPLVVIVRGLFNYGPPLVVVLGLVLNCMTFSVLSTPALSGSSLSVYLRALAVTDNFALLFNVTVSFTRAHVPALAQQLLTHEWLCALNKVLLGMTYYYSTWLVVSLTWERLATITHPLTLGVWCSKKVAIIVVIMLGVLFFMVGVVRVRYSGFEQDSVFEYEPCAVQTAPTLTTYMYGYLALSLWLPLVLILVGNLCLVAEVRRSARTRSALTAAKDRDTMRLTRMLLIVSVAYVVLLLPVGVVATLELFWNMVVKPSSHLQDSALYVHWLKGKLLLKWLRGLFYFIYLFNFCINFFLYCMSGKKFRQAAVQHFQRRLSHPLSRIYKSSPSASLQGDSLRKPSNPSNTVAPPAYVNDAFLADETHATWGGETVHTGSSVGPEK